MTELLLHDLRDVLRPGDEGYDDARRLHNAMVDVRPALIARCATAADVVAALAHARSHGLDVSVRGGGHGVAGTALAADGLVVDLTPMREAVVDPGGRTARVGGGALMADLDAACAPHGLATTGGRVSTTGVAGLTLGGGTGWLDRAFGLTCDNLVEVELVTADGRVVRASHDEHPELFWALHGGGGNFGVVTALTLRLHPLPEFSIGFFVVEPDDAAAATTAFRDLVESGPLRVSGGVLHVMAPPEEFVPAQLVATPVALVVVTLAGPAAELRALTTGLRALRPAGELLLQLPYDEAQRMIDDPPGQRNYWSAEHLAALPDEAVAAFTDAAAEMPRTGCQHVLFAAGGAVAERAAEADPLAWRAAPWVAHPFAVWDDPADDERCRAWVQQVRRAVRPWSTGAVYQNFIGAEGADRVRAGFGAAWPRLVAVKREWDPANVFHHTHAIDPAG